MIDDQQNPNAGDPGAGGVAPDQGGSSVQNPAAGAGAPGGDGGQQPNMGADELTQAKAEIRRLNRALASRGSSTNRQSPNPAGDGGENPFETPQGQYAITIKLATANLAGKLESVYSLYPEIPADEIARIRRNPWAYVSNNDLYFKGDWEGAAEDIEYYLLDRAEALKAAGQNPTPPKGGGTLPVNPVVVNANPPAEPPNPQAAPGTGDDANPWTMPMDKLKLEKDKAVQRIKSKK